MTDLPPGLYTALVAFAGLPRVVVGVDFDGTLAPFVTDPRQARAVPGSLDTLRAASRLPGVTVAVVSGRDLAALAQLTGLAQDEAVVLIGSHGAECRDPRGVPGVHGGSAPSAGVEGADDPQTGTTTADRLTPVTAALEAVARAHPPARVEHKATAVALHTRGLPPKIAGPALAAAHDVAARHHGVHVLTGKDVVELAVVEASKGAALRALARAHGAAATAYLGDDVTDERAFAALSPESGDVTIKVGAGETVAAHRVPGIPAVLQVLETFVAAREQHRSD